MDDVENDRTSRVLSGNVVDGGEIVGERRERKTYDRVGLSKGRNAATSTMAEVAS